MEFIWLWVLGAMSTYIHVMQYDAIEYSLCFSTLASFSSSNAKHREGVKVPRACRADFSITISPSSAMPWCSTRVLDAVVGAGAAGCRSSSAEDCFYVTPSKWHVIRDEYSHVTSLHLTVLKRAHTGVWRPEFFRFQDIYVCFHLDYSLGSLMVVASTDTLATLWWCE